MAEGVFSNAYVVRSDLIIISFFQSAAS